MDAETEKTLRKIERGRQIKQRNIADYFHYYLPHCSISFDVHFLNVYPANINGICITVHTTKDAKIKHCIVKQNGTEIKYCYSIEECIKFLKTLEK